MGTQVPRGDSHYLRSHARYDTYVVPSSAKEITQNYIWDNCVNPSLIGRARKKILEETECDEDVFDRWHERLLLHCHREVHWFVNIRCVCCTKRRAADTIDSGTIQNGIDIVAKRSLLMDLFERLILRRKTGRMRKRRAITHENRIREWSQGVHGEARVAPYPERPRFSMMMSQLNHRHLGESHHWAEGAIVAWVKGDVAGRTNQVIIVQVERIVCLIFVVTTVRHKTKSVRDHRRIK
ncbi:hypothetical protein PROFUN_11768 [Planoprotostelium fungivorum]|uniref:Uncharacterized protein n=1 Tax=Planoprotostelium fungivorum TaxID=1890364 RepID=A0A2P6N8L7_9EUKA|nr:hypothetical protein PROFUN_11768 [Planoprotostelium fungivorum]